MSQKKAPKLYIPPEADAQLKEVLKGQQGVAETVYSLEELSQGGPKTIKALQAIAKAHIRAVRALPTTGKKINSLKELRAFGREVEQKNQALLQQAAAEGKLGNAKLKMATRADLLRLSKLSPEEIAAEINATQLSQIGNSPFQEDQQPEAKETKKSFGKRPESLPQQENLTAHLSDLTQLITQTKFQFQQLQVPWEQIRLSEQRLQKKTETIEDCGSNGIQFLLYVLSGDFEQTEKITAARVLGSIHSEKHLGVDALLDYWVASPADSEVIIPGLKYAVCPHLPDQLQRRFSLDPEAVRIGYITVLDYKRWPVRLAQPLSSYPPGLQAAVLKLEATQGEDVSFSDFHHLLEDPTADYFETALLAGLLAGDSFALKRCREVCRDTYEEAGNLPLLLAIAGDHEDLPILEQCFEQESPSLNGIKALGLYGCPFVIPKLIELLKDDNSEPVKLPTLLKIKDAAIEALELITGAGLEKPIPEVVLGEKIEEGDVKIFSHLYEPWNEWWSDNREPFEQHARWRRGEPFHSHSGVDEMAYPKGNYWSRQHSYYELMIRYGQNLPFEADEYVNTQKEMISVWERWITDNQHRFVDFPWLFSGKRVR